jgi:hypothetical protein
MACREESPYLRTDVLDCQDVLLLHDQILHAIELDFLTGVLAEEDGVACLDIQRHPLATVFGLAVPGGDHLAVLRLLLGGIGDDDRAGSLRRFLEALDENPVVQRSDIHGLNS